MMNFTEDKPSSDIFFKEYSDGVLKLNIGDFTSSLVLSKDSLLAEDDSISTLDDITDSYLDMLLESTPEIILIGTGSKQEIPTVDIINYLAKKGLSADFMTTNAACKTYNLLINENRNVCAIVIA